MTSLANDEAKLSAQYRQPKGVEQFGIEPIPENLKTVKWFDLFSIVFNFLVNPGIILVGGLAVVAGLSFWEAVLAQTLGVALAFAAYIVMATIGVDYGLPGQVATRMTFGLRGAKWMPSLLRSIASVFWFAFQTLAGALAIVAVLNKWFGVEFSLVVVSLVFAILQVIVALVGYNSLKLLSRIAFPLKIIILLYLAWLLMSHSEPAFVPSTVMNYAGTTGAHWAIFALWVNASAGAWFSMITDASDFCRYSRTRADMWIGTIAAAVAGTFLAGFLGAYGAAASLGAEANVFEVLVDINSSWPVLAMILLVVALDNWTINVLNLYTGGLSLSNIFERVGRFWTTLFVSALGIALSLAPSIVNSYEHYVGVLGNMFAPIAGILLVDYVVFKKGKIDMEALFDESGRYWYWGGFNLVAISWAIFGFLVCTLWVPISWLPTLVALVVTAIGYYITVRALIPRSSVLQRAKHVRDRGVEASLMSTSHGKLAQEPAEQ